MFKDTVTVEIEKECGCFKKSDFIFPMHFTDMQTALFQAEMLCNVMNREFCQKHRFAPIQNGNEKVLIKVKERAKEENHGDRCCGGGHCS